MTPCFEHVEFASGDLLSVLACPGFWSSLHLLLDERSNGCPPLPRVMVHIQSFILRFCIVARIIIILYHLGHVLVESFLFHRDQCLLFLQSSWSTLQTLVLDPSVPNDGLFSVFFVHVWQGFC